MIMGEKLEHKIIGICCAKIQDDYVREIVMSICSQADKNGFRVIIFNAFSDMYRSGGYMMGEKSIYSLINFSILDAIVILPESIKSDSLSNMIVQKADSAGIPVVSVDRKIAGCCSILFDYTHTFEKIIRHVVQEHKCTKVNFIAGIKGNSFSEERLDCYKKVLVENNIEVEDKRIGYGDFWELPTKMVVQKFLADENDLPQAIICCNDTMAITACRIIAQKGYKVPQDIIVTGFDGIDLEKYVVPRLTTAAVDIEGLGVKTIESIMDIAAGGERDKVLYIPFKLRISQSCGCEMLNAQSPAEKIMELYNKMNNSQGHEAHMFAYLAKTVGCETNEDLAKVIARYSDYYMWICLNSDIFSKEKSDRIFNGSFTEQMNLLMQCEGEKYIANIDFKTEDLLPNLPEALDKHKYLLFSPVHYQEEVLGYSVVAINTEDFAFSNTHRFINNTNQILESYKNRKRLEAAYAQMEQMHITDPMTGIYNRRGFYAKAELLIKKCCELNMKVILFSADLDGLKEINDNYGHNMGDIAIKAAADILSSFKDNYEICSRFGGDEFVLLAAAEDAEKYAACMEEKIRRKIAEYNKNHEEPFELKISLGYSSLEKCMENNLDEIIKAADIHMYEQKRKRKAQENKKTYRIKGMDSKGKE